MRGEVRLHHRNVVVLLRGGGRSHEQRHDQGKERSHDVLDARGAERVYTFTMMLRRCSTHRMPSQKATKASPHNSEPSFAGKYGSKKN